MADLRSTDAAVRAEPPDGPRQMSSWRRDAVADALIGALDPGLRRGRLWPFLAAPARALQKMPAPNPAASPAPRSRQRSRSAGPIVLAARMASGVCALVHTISGAATARSRQPVAIRAIWRAALSPSLPAQIRLA